MKGKFDSLQWMALAALGLAAVGCASIGRPTGGEKDITPPEFVRSNPAPEAINVKNNKIEIFFDENVQLEDAFNKVVVSPAQVNTPTVSANGHKVSVTLKDSLIPNMTYTIDFGDAIKDLNEGNVLDGFATSFSTGDSIDTLRISGMVFEARTLEPAQSMLVGIYRVPDRYDSVKIDSLLPYTQAADTNLYTQQLERISRTNQYGQFTVHNLKPGNYAVYALNDINRDYKWDRTEDVAFLGTTVSPYVSAIEVVDTLRAWDNSDSLVSRPGIAYYPNDVLLTWFNEGYAPQYLKDYNRPVRNRLNINMNTKADSLPEITIAKGAMEGRDIREWTRMHPNPTLDSLEYWISDSAVIKTDSLWLSVRYQRTDTNDMLTWKTDTLKFFFKDPKSNDKKKDKKKKEDDKPKTKKIIDDEGNEIEVPDTVKEEVKITFMKFAPISGTTQELNLPIVFESDQPIDTLLEGSYRLEVKEDSLWYPVEGIRFVADSLKPLTRRKIFYPWEEGADYRLTIDSASVFGMYDQWNDAIKHEFKIKGSEEYSTLTFNISGLDGRKAVVELLDKSDKPIATVPVEDGQAVLEYLNPGQVYARLFIDENGDGEWTTGDLKAGQQPEEVYYFSKRLNLRKNWSIAESWDIYGTPIDLQKPYELVKNKPKKKGKDDRQNSYSDEEEEDDPFGGGGYGYGGYGTTNYGLRP